MTKSMLTAQVDADLWTRINEAAKTRGVNRSKLVRDAITVALDLAELFPDSPVTDALWNLAPVPAPTTWRYWRCPFGHEFGERNATKPACCRSCGYTGDDGTAPGLVEIDGFTK